MPAAQTNAMPPMWSVGPDAVDLEPFTAVRTEDSELRIHEEDAEESWLQCDLWVDPVVMS